jgi:hypothetical protein
MVAMEDGSTANYFKG